MCYDMTMSSNENIFHITGHLCREFTGHRWIPRTKASNTELWCFLNLNKRLSKQWWGWWFEMPSCPLWCHCSKNIAVKTKWLPFYIWHFQILFCWMKLLSFKSNFIELSSSLGSNWHNSALVQVMPWFWTGDKPLSGGWITAILQMTFKKILEWKSMNFV